MNPLNWFSTVASKVLGGALAASLIANIFLFWGYNHQTVKKAECVQAVKVVNQQATEKKQIIEKRQDNATQGYEQLIRSRIAAVSGGVHYGKGRQSDLPQPANPTASTDRASGDPLFFTVNDERICKVNTIKLIGWQEWYAEQQRIRQEELNGTDAKDSSVPSPRGGSGTGGVSGLGERLDLGAGSDEPLGTSSIPSVFPQPSGAPALH